MKSKVQSLELMETWWRFSDEIHVFKGSGGNGGVEGGKNRIKNLFDQVLEVFLSEISKKKGLRTLPVLTGCGKPLDLFKLYWTVREKGGYALVSRNELWGYVAENCGLDTGFVAFMKLVYVRYLSEFDRWLQQLLKDGNLVEGEGGVIRKLDLLSKELETMFSNLFPLKNGCREEVDFEMFTAESVNETNDYTEHRSCTAAHRKHGLHTGGKRSVSKIASDTIFLVSTEGIVEEILYRPPAKSSRQNDNDDKLFGKNNSTATRKVIQGAVAKKTGVAEKVNNEKENLSARNGYDTHAALRKNVIEDVTVSRKRKRDSPCFSDMLNWIKYVAKHSNDPAIGKVPNSLKWKGQTGKWVWFQALAIREARLRKNHIDTGADEADPQNQQKKQRMHPSMYEAEKLNNQPAEKLRFSKRIPTLRKHILCRGCSSCSTSRNKVETRQKKEDDTAPDLKSVEVSVTEKTEDSDDQEMYSEGPKEREKRAEVPEWTGVISESDSKWLGTRMWPPEVEKTKSLVELDPIGKGRQSSCGCPFPRTTECNRFHIAEKRFKLKLELGALFFQWRFDNMGEEVSLSWTAKEEQRFKAAIKPSNPKRKRLWDNYETIIPSRTRNMLVSYYFNVFLIKCRSYQNRVTPRDIDSDDDEKEFGRVGGNFGDIAVHVPSSRPLLNCSQNKVCTDLE